MRSIRKLIPNLSTLDAQSEIEFRRYLMLNSQRAITLTALSFVSLMLLFCAVDISLGSAWFSLGNSSRFLACLLILSFLSIHKLLPIVPRKQGWLAITALSILLLGVTFYDNARYFGRLGEGGPMLVCMAIVIIPIFHLTQKLLLWLLLLSVVVFLKLGLQVDTGWTLYYLVLTSLLCTLFQRQLDKLLRGQFKAVRLEQQKAETDQLTGVLNRRSFEQRLQQKMAELTPGQQLSLGLLDIDYFKRYNDHYGHLDGDLVLVQLSRLLSADKSRIVVRFGGEEFVLVEQHNENEAPAMLTLPKSLSELALPHASSPFGVVTASLGVITLPYQQPPVSTSYLMQQADALLYQAKNQGRNQTSHQRIG